MQIIHFETLGCKLNQIETESLAHAFREAGFLVDSDPVYRPVGIDPSLFVLNTCTVTGKAEQKARRVIRLMLRANPEATVLVTGCYAEVEQAAIKTKSARRKGQRNAEHAKARVRKTKELPVVSSAPPRAAPPPVIKGYDPDSVEAYDDE